MSNDDSIAALAGKVSDHSSVLQSLQITVGHIEKSVDALVEASKQQADLVHQLARHSEALDRLGQTIRDDRQDAKEISKTVGGFSASLRTLKQIGGAVTALLVVIATMFASNVTKDFQLVHAELSDHATDRSAIKIKMDALAMQVQEVRLDRQRDQELKATKQ